MTAVLSEVVGSVANAEPPLELPAEPPETIIETTERLRIAAIIAGRQAVIVTVHGEVVYEPKIAGQGQPFANWTRSRLSYSVTVNGEKPPR